MGPLQSLGIGPQAGFPRVSGDEPRAVLTKAAAALFSPCERG